MNVTNIYWNKMLFHNHVEPYGVISLTMNARKYCNLLTNYFSGPTDDNTFFTRYNTERKLAEILWKFWNKLRNHK